MTNSANRKEHSPKLLDATGNEVTDPRDIVELFMESFSSMRISNVALNHLENCSSASNLYILPTDRYEIINIINITVKHSAGIDDIPCFIIKYVSSNIVDPLVYIINQCLSEGVFPDDLKIGKTSSIKLCLHCVLFIKKKGFSSRSFQEKLNIMKSSRPMDLINLETKIEKSAKKFTRHFHVGFYEK